MRQLQSSSFSLSVLYLANHRQFNNFKGHKQAFLLNEVVEDVRGTEGEAPRDHGGSEVFHASNIALQVKGGYESAIAVCVS